MSKLRLIYFVLMILVYTNLSHALNWPPTKTNVVAEHAKPKVETNLKSPDNNQGNSIKNLAAGGRVIVCNADGSICCSCYIVGGMPTQCIACTVVSLRPKPIVSTDAILLRDHTLAKQIQSLLASVSASGCGSTE